MNLTIGKATENSNIFPKKKTETKDKLLESLQNAIIIYQISIESLIFYLFEAYSRMFILAPFLIVTGENLSNSCKRPDRCDKCYSVTDMKYVTYVTGVT